MYRCQKCNRPLSEFDIKFNHCAFPNRSIEDCQCFRCTTSGVSVEAFRAAQGKGPSAYAKDYVILILCSLIFALLYLWYSVAFLPEWCYWVAILGILLLGLLWMVFGFTFLADHGFGGGESYTTGEYHYESKIRDDGTIETRKVEETAGGAGCFLEFPLAVTFILWYPFYFIYFKFVRPTILANKLARKYPPEVIRAFEYSYNNIPRYAISPKDIAKYKKQNETYVQRRQSIQRQYAIMGPDAVQQEIEKISPPIVSITLNGKRYVIVENITGKYNQYSCWLLLRKNQQGQPEGCIIIDNYKVYSDPSNWLQDWHDIGISQEQLNRLDLYRSYLRKNFDSY